MPAQEAHWELACALSPDDPGRSRQLVLDYRHLQGDVDRRALMRAFTTVSRRHEALRTVFGSVGHDPDIRVEDDPEPPVEYLDLTGQADRRRQDRIEELVFDAAHRCFNLRTGPLWYAWLLRLGATSHCVVLSMSHLVADGWSGKVFVDDLLEAYAAQVGDRPPLADEDVPSLAEVRALQVNRYRPLPERLRYWRDRLAVLPEPLFTPTASVDADLLARRSLTFSIAPGTAAQLRRLAWSARTTPFVALLAAYHLQLGMTAGKSRTVISIASLAGVPERERRAICIHGIDPYVAVELAEDCSLLDAVRQTHESLTGALLNLVSFTSVAREVNPDFDTYRPWPDTYLFDGNFIDSAFRLGQLDVSGVRVVRPQVHLRSVPSTYVPDLVWSRLPASSRRVWATLSGPGFEINSDRAGGVLHYNRDVFSTELMREHVDCFLWTVEALTSTPHQTVGALRDRHARRSPP